MKIIIAFSSILLLLSCQNKSAKNFEQLNKTAWLIGNWSSKMPEGTLTESWKKLNDSTYLASSYFILNNAKDTLHNETITLTQKEEDLIYSATVKGQNNNEPVAFKYNPAIENEFVFENPSHDYPQRISYKKISNTKLVATISGTQQGKTSQESYPMTKK
jgi:hypothetical protein